MSSNINIQKGEKHGQTYLNAQESNLSFNFTVLLSLHNISYIFFLFSHPLHYYSLFVHINVVPAAGGP